MVADLNMFAPQRCPRLVIKIGSSLLVEQDGRVRTTWLAGFIDEVGLRRREGQKVIIVSSGAIALGARRMGFPQGGRASLEDAQAAAAVGQILLSQIYAELLHADGMTAAQLLLTLDDLENRRRFLNVSSTLARLLEAGAVPIINENDSVTTAEIRFGDNDRLAARLGQAANATGVILLSDVAGFFTGDPRHDPTARLMPTVSALTPELRAMAGRPGSGMGSGGMASKVEAAQIAMKSGVPLAIISGQVDRPLTVFERTGQGTIFLPDPQPVTARKRWLSGRLTVRGQVHVDAGAEAALRSGKSLLPAGVTNVSGDFERGDVVDIVSPAGERIGRGLAGYDAGDATRIAGRKSEDVRAILGYAPRSALIHRDDMVML